ncbi:hypothetical protein [Actibacterium ureilyticum]|uniref:hypothetical protein n=1 Tax=Actibacterium ureilyticum TaxID=1590614 RepID=UPI000BAAFDFD|nr:hypothetical protein [Actibacterium ureilyticum]
MTESLPLLLHVGYHKTATSWMQNRLFTPDHGYAQLCGHQQVHDLITNPHGLQFDPHLMRDLIDTARQKVPQGAVPVISSEILSGHHFTGGYQSDVYAWRLKEIAPRALILLSIRSQMTILPSCYMQYLMSGGTMPWPQFFRGERDIGYPAFSPVHFEYDRLIDHYQTLFGAENVHVVTQESIAHDMGQMADELAAFTGNRLYSGLSDSARVIYAPSYAETTAPVLRRINHVQSSMLNRCPVIELGHTPTGLFKLYGAGHRRVMGALGREPARPIRAYVRDTFGDRFGDSNRRLAALVPGLDLSDYP